MANNGEAKCWQSSAMSLGPRIGFGAIPEAITTERLELRRPTLGDASFIFEYAGDAEVTRWMDWPTHKTIETVVQYLRTCAALWDSGEEYTWIITLASSKQPIGGVSLRIRGHMADFGYKCWKKSVSHRRAHCEAGQCARISRSNRVTRSSIPRCSRRSNFPQRYFRSPSPFMAEITEGRVPISAT